MKGRRLNEDENARVPPMVDERHVTNLPSQAQTPNMDGNLPAQPELTQLPPELDDNLAPQPEAQELEAPIQEEQQ
jgi:hypothetical protein